MKTKFFFLIAASLFTVSSALAEMNYSIDGRFRSKPSAFNAWGTVGYDGLLWGEYNREKPMYGYYRVGGRFGGSPNYAAFVQVAPIAPLVFEVQKGNTHRFMSINTIDCDLVECKGKVERTDYIVRLGAAYKDFVFGGGAMWRELKTEDSTKAIGLELEMFTVSPGFHRYFETNFVAGYKLANGHMVGATVINGVVSEGERKMSAAYGIYRLPWNDFTITGGLGSYKSDQPDQDGTSAILTFGRTWGERLSLF